jgi:hypothetical protein
VGWLQGVMFTRCYVWHKLTEVVIFPVFPPGNCCGPEMALQARRHPPFDMESAQFTFKFPLEKLVYSNVCVE